MSPRLSANLQIFAISKTSANFHINPFGGASTQIGEMLWFCDFFPGWLVG